MHLQNVIFPSYTSLGPTNEFVTLGTHSAHFRERTGKTHYYGVRSREGEVWKARGRHHSLQAGFRIERISDVIMEAILRHAQEQLAPFKEPSKGVPDPAFTLQLPDEVYMGSNLYAFQKTLRGEFQFDIFFDSGSVAQKLSCECSISLHTITLTNNVS